MPTGRQLVMEDDESEEVQQKQHEQMLKLVSRSFYRELINYGVSDAEVLSVAGHLLDNVMQHRSAPAAETVAPPSGLSLRNIKDEWDPAKRLTLEQVSLRPFTEDLAAAAAGWLRTPAIRESFYPRFPNGVKRLSGYLLKRGRDYFAICYEGAPVGLVGAENIDPSSTKLEMRKLVGDPEMHGKGIGKRATFLFLYYVFHILQYEKVYVHSLDTNIRNLNLNARFGFELEGVFLQDVLVRRQRRDLVRMALLRETWQRMFAWESPPATS